MNFFSILAATIPVFLIVGVGFVVRRLGIINDESEKSVMKLVIYVLYPCFILSKVPGNESLNDVSLVLIAILCGFLLVVAAMIVSQLLARMAGMEPDRIGTFCVSTSIQNYGFIPIPLIIALFPDEADETLGVLFVHNLGLEIAMWTLGLMMLSGTLRGAWRRIINGPTIAILVGLTLNYTGLHHWVPGVVNQAILDLGLCSIPIALVLIGAALAGVLEGQQWQTHWKVITTSSLVRFAVMPPLFFVVAAWLSRSPELQRVLIVQAAMPTAIFPIVLAKHFGGRPNIAVQIAIASSLLSLLLTPLILLLGAEFMAVPPSR